MRVPDWAPVLTDTATPSALVLRGHRPEDVDAVLDQCRDPEFERWTGIPWPYRRSHAEEFVRTREGEWTAGRYLGLAVETVSRLFSRLQDDGILVVHSRHVQLRDISRLQALAGL